MVDARKFYQVVDLFTQGRELVIGTGEQALVLWIARVNSFERAEINKTGSAGRAMRLALLRKDDDEMRIVDQYILDHDDEELIDALVGMKSNEIYLKAIDDLRADPEWKDRLEAVDRGGALLMDQLQTPNEEAVRLAELQNQYFEEIGRRSIQFEATARAEIENLEGEELATEYRKAVQQALGANVWMEETRITEIYYATRECASPPDKFDHSECDHSQRFFPTRASVRQVPDEFFQVIRDTLNLVNIPLREAGNSAAPRSSSASSERQDVAEESTVSTPTET